MDTEHKTKVLMLDDEKFLLEIYKVTFEKNGYEIATYYDADTALGVLRGGYDPDVILFDVTMPDSKSGYEFIETVKSEGLSKRSLKFVLTNEGQDAEIKRLLELGADGHFLKAKYIPSELVAAITEMLKKRQGA